MSLFMAAAGMLSIGRFERTWANTESLTALDADGQNVTGVLTIDTQGNLSWDADQGSDEAHEYWEPQDIYTPGPLLQVRLSFSSGVNHYQSGAGLAAYVALSTTRSWTFFKATAGGPDTDQGDFTLDFSWDGSTAFDTTTLDISLTEQSP